MHKMKGNKVTWNNMCNKHSVIWLIKNAFKSKEKDKPKKEKKKIPQLKWKCIRHENELQKQYSYPLNLLKS